MSVDYSMLPEHMQDGARLYVERGIEPGGFMMAVLCNDLSGAAARADHINRECLHEWAAWAYNELPSPAWGSPAKVADWMDRGGLQGRSPTPAQQEYAATHVSPERLLQAFDEIDANRRKEELEIMRSRGEL